MTSVGQNDDHDDEAWKSGSASRGEPFSTKWFKQLILNEDDLIAAMKAFRKAAGKSQLDVDHGIQVDVHKSWPDGYTGKLENPTKSWGRRAIPKPFWFHMRRHGLITRLYPIDDKDNSGRCPCCGAARGAEKSSDVSD